ncbi:MAG: hypothetical protein HFE68_07525 [Erysipelotrichaceae bacterium]|nr:hypothetical protein [Erysipelotrichaceae bacterium]
MVEVKSIHLQNKAFIGMHLQLPTYPVYLITSTKTILTQQMFDIRYFQKERSIAVIITEYRYGFEALLHAPVIAMNEIARRRGVTTMMSGKEALLLCEAKKA